MPQNDTITCAAGSWTLLTSNNVSALRAVHLGSEAIWLQATVGTTPPSGLAGTAGALPLLPNQILAADLSLADLFPGISGANRVYAYAPALTRVSVSHA
jgi:hypothetical protein